MVQVGLGGIPKSPSSLCGVHRGACERLLKILSSACMHLINQHMLAHGTSLEALAALLNRVQDEFKVKEHQVELVGFKKSQLTQTYVHKGASETS